MVKTDVTFNDMLTGKSFENELFNLSVKLAKGIKVNTIIYLD